MRVTYVDKIIMMKIFDEIFLFETEKHVTRQDRIAIESIIGGMWEDHEEVTEMDTYQLLEWILAEIKNEIGLDLKTVGIECEFSVKR